MPVYSFVCADCGMRFEKRLGINEMEHVPACPSGHAHVRRVFSAPAIVFKGSGFYQTDHRKKATGEAQD